MNHCLLEVKVQKPPTVRYTQDNKTPIAEMEVLFEGLRTDDPPGNLKVVGWGNLAQEMQSRVQADQKIVIEGRLRMNTIPRQDGTKEKRAELTLSRLHILSDQPSKAINQGEFPNKNTQPAPNNSPTTSQADKPLNAESEEVSWNSSPLVPDTDDIPF